MMARCIALEWIVLQHAAHAPERNMARTRAGHEEEACSELNETTSPN